MSRLMQLLIDLKAFWISVCQVNLLEDVRAGKGILKKFFLKLTNFYAYFLQQGWE